MKMLVDGVVDIRERGCTEVGKSKGAGLRQEKKQIFIQRKLRRC